MGGCGKTGAERKSGAAASFDADSFGAALRAARDKTTPSEAEEQKHLADIELWTVVLGVAGALLAARGVISPLAMLAIGLYRFGKFAILAHHSLHGGWGRTRRGWYAQGSYRRIVDWLDWIFPDAWIMEHNKLHHYKLNEDTDPDFVERNTELIQGLPLPLPVKYAVVLQQAATWKWFYYASNTLKTLHADKPGAPCKEELDEPITLNYLLKQAVLGDPWHRALAADLFLRVLAPPFVVHFLVLPVLAGAARGLAFPFCWTTFFNLVGAELYTNIHAFAMIVTNHAGQDLWWFDCPCKPDSAEFYLRAILGSTAYHTGSDLVDYIHGYLNYQGEHHAFPDLTPLHYQRLHPKFVKVCQEFRVPYVKEPVWTRVRKTADVMVGVAKHKRMSGLAIETPAAWLTSPKSASTCKARSE